MRRYAQDTSVSEERSKGEIERVLRRYGATQFVTGWDHEQAMIGFRADNRMLRFTLPMPKREQFAQTARGRERSETVIDRQWEQARRQGWRALGLVIKAKLEAVTAGIATFEEEFLAYIILPNGKTVYELTKNEIATAYTSGKMKALLPAFGPGSRSAEKTE